MSEIFRRKNSYKITHQFKESKYTSCLHRIAMLYTLGEITLIKKNPFIFIRKRYFNLK